MRVSGRNAAQRSDTHGTLIGYVIATRRYLFGYNQLVNCDGVRNHGAILSSKRAVERGRDCACVVVEGDQTTAPTHYVERIADQDGAVMAPVLASVYA